MSDTDPLVKVMMGMIALAMMVGVVGMYAPTVHACPLCPSTFGSIAELEEHFRTEHPAELIEIIWE